MKNRLAEAHYSIPKTCEACGSDNVLAKCISYEDGSIITRVVCVECGASRSLPKAENLAKRTNATLTNWRTQVLKRDGYKCKICGARYKLQAHHIIPVRSSSRHMYEINNGITLCNTCHSLVHHGDSRDINSDEAVRAISDYCADQDCCGDKCGFYDRADGCSLLSRMPYDWIREDDDDNGNRERA